MAEYLTYLIALGILVGAYILSFIVMFILNQIMHLAKKTQTKLDDEIIAELKKPVRVIAIFAGLYFAINYIDPLLELFGFHFSRYFSIIGVFVVAYLLSNIIGSVFKWYTKEIAPKGKKQMDHALFRFLRKFVVIVVYVIALIIVLSMLNVEIAPLVAGLGIAGLAVALALQDTLSSILSAVYLTADKPIKIGDIIEVDDKIKGTVEDIGWRSTRIRTAGNNKIIVPNTTLANSVIMNYDESDNELSLVIPIGVGYSSDLKKVEKITIEVATQAQKKLDGAVKTYTPLFRYKEFGDSSINFIIILRAKSYGAQFLFRSEFIKMIKERFDKEKIEIPFPQTDVWMRK